MESALNRLLTRRTFCTGLGATAALLSQPALASASANATPTKRPNVVYILADDLGWGDIDAFNPHSEISTPVLNGFARQGLRFTDMHSSSAVCTPSRYSILTGRYCWRSRLKKGVLGGNSFNLIEEGRMTVPSMLKTAGYYTAGVGKWHLGLGNDEKKDFSKPLTPGPNSHGFDYFFGIPASLDMAPYYYFENEHVVEAPTVQDPGQKQPPRGVFWREGLRAPHFDFPQVLPTITQRAVDLIQQRAKTPDTPFFLYVALPAPHTPWLPLPEFRGKSKAGDYGDYVVEVDTMIGGVLGAIKQAGLDENTIVVTTSDNGAWWAAEDIKRTGHRANDDWRGEKADVWEAGHRIPFMVRWPGRVAPDTVTNETASLTDLMGTLAAVLHISLPENAGEDSFNNLPIWLAQKHAPIRKSIIDHSNDGMFTIREGDWKLELGLGSGGFTPPEHVEPVQGGPLGQLYNLADDPHETNNLWLQKPDIVNHLTKMLEEQQTSGHTRY